MVEPKISGEKKLQQIGVQSKNRRKFDIKQHTVEISVILTRKLTNWRAVESEGLRSAVWIIQTKTKCTETMAPIQSEKKII